jgi:hypothetical protein
VSPEEKVLLRGAPGAGGSTIGPVVRTTDVPNVKKFSAFTNLDEKCNVTHPNDS